jgi:hypothetical protein
MATSSRIKRLLPLGVSLAVVLVALLALAWAQSAPSAHAQGSGVLSLRLEGDGTGCDDDANPTECNMDEGTEFTLVVDIVEFPEGGYISTQSFIDFGELVYTPTEQADEEIVQPDFLGFQLRGQTCPTCVNHGGTTAMIPPFPISTYSGPFVQLAMACSDEFSANNVELIPYGTEPAGTDGAVFVLEDSSQVIVEADSVAVNCGEAPPPDEDEPTDTPEATALPPTGAGPISAVDNDGDGNTGLWIALGAVLAAAAAAGLGLFAWRRVGTR